VVIKRNIFLASVIAAAMALLAAFSVFAGSSAEASVTCSKYASPSGSDSASGTLAAPFKTAQRLVSVLQPGETGCLRQGDYTPTGTYVFSMARGGTASAPITVTSYPGEHATIQGITQVPAGDNYVTLSDMTFEGTAGMNTIKIYSTGVHVENNEVTNNWAAGSCMMLGSNSAGQALQPVISGNVFHACGSPADGNKDHGIYAANVNEGEIVNNLFYDSAAYAIQLYPNAQKTTFAHNVIDGSSPSVRGGLVFGGDEEFASSGNVVEQNVIAFATTYDIASVWGGAVGSGNLARNNCLYGGGEGQLSNAGGLTATSNLTANPQFVGATEDDFRLASGSPCLAEVGYDTVAAIESGGVQIPVEEGGPAPSPPAEGGPVEEGPTAPPIEESSPVVPPVVTPPSRQPGSGSGSAGEGSHGSSSGNGETVGSSSGAGKAGGKKRKPRRVQVHRTGRSPKVAAKTKAAAHKQRQS
jgi:hypothetical protein